MKERADEPKVVPTPDPAPARTPREPDEAPRRARERYDEELPSGTFRIPRL